MTASHEFWACARCRFHYWTLNPRVDGSIPCPSCKQKLVPSTFTKFLQSDTRPEVCSAFVNIDDPNHDSHPSG